MTYKEYRFIKKIYEKAPQMDKEQKYKLHFICDVEKMTGLSMDDVLTLATDLSQKGYMSIAQNSQDAKERSGYIHLLRITYKGVSEMKMYKCNAIWTTVKNIIVPAIVSIITSLIVYQLCN